MSQGQQLKPPAPFSAPLAQSGDSRFWLPLAWKGQPLRTTPPPNVPSLNRGGEHGPWALRKALSLPWSTSAWGLQQCAVGSLAPCPHLEVWGAALPLPGAHPWVFLQDPPGGLLQHQSSLTCGHTAKPGFEPSSSCLYPPFAYAPVPYDRPASPVWTLPESWASSLYGIRENSDIVGVPSP